MVWQLSCCVQYIRVHIHETNSSYTWAICLFNPISTTINLTESGDLYATEYIRNCIVTASHDLENHVEFQKTFKKFEEFLTSTEFETLVENACKKRTNNEVWKFLLFYIKMVKRLLFKLHGLAISCCNLTLQRKWYSTFLALTEWNIIECDRFILLIYTIFSIEILMYALYLWEISGTKTDVPGTATGQDNTGD